MKKCYFYNLTFILVFFCNLLFVFLIKYDQASYNDNHNYENTNKKTK